MTELLHGEQWDLFSTLSLLNNLSWLWTSLDKGGDWRQWGAGRLPPICGQLSSLLQVCYTKPSQYIILKLFIFWIWKCGWHCIMLRGLKDIIFCVRTRTGHHHHHHLHHQCKSDRVSSLQENLRPWRSCSKMMMMMILTVLIYTCGL